MRCGFCGRDFIPDVGKERCRSCPLRPACVKVKCPYCNYENPPEPALLRGLKHLVKRKRELQ